MCVCNGLFSFPIMRFQRCLSFISVAHVILATHARPQNLFLSDFSDTVQPDALVDDLSFNPDFSWSSNELASFVPNLTLDPLAQDGTSETDDTGLFADFSSDLFATDPSDSFISSSACNTEDSLTTGDFLQARDERSSCSNTGKQQDINPPNLYDENFLPQNIDTPPVKPADPAIQESGSKQKGVGWGAMGLNIPAALRLKEDPQLCPPEIFIASITPVCNNPITGRISYEFANMYATMFNVISCM